ncbi:MAG: 50S ribosomal protein L11 methyltransferase, partial [Ketobacter sp.]
LGWLDSTDLHDKTVIDYGCGSGILAIAAALLGADKVYCVDNDPQALLATQQNAERNQIQDKMEVFAPAALPSINVDILLANILAGPLISLSKHLASLTKPSGQIVLSGILKEQSDQVSDCYSAWFDMQKATIDGDWVRLTGTRKHD